MESEAAARTFFLRSWSRFQSVVGAHQNNAHQPKPQTHFSHTHLQLKSQSDTRR